MKLKTKMSLILGMTILSVTPVMQAKAIDILTSKDIKCTQTKEWKEYQKLSKKDQKGVIPPIQCEEMKTSSSNIQVVGAPLISDAASATKFDLRNVNGKNYVTSIKNQYQTSLCWAFATASSIESNYLINNGNELNISELQMGYSTSYQLKDGTNPYGLKLKGAAVDTVSGGNSILGIGNFLSQRRGVVTESTSGLTLNDSNFKTITDSTSGKLSDVNQKNEYNVNDVIIYAPGLYCNENNFAVLKEIKQMVASYGSVLVQINASTNKMIKISDTEIQDNTSIYYAGPTADHGVSIIGWDDNYSASNFVNSSGVTPKGDGAWIVKNSYGTEMYTNTSKDISYTKDSAHPITVKMGDNGYYYVSYYDTQVCKAAMAVDNVTPANDTNNYSYSKPGLAQINVGQNGLTMTKYEKKNTDTELLESFSVFTWAAGDKVKIYYGTSSDFSKATLVAETTANNTGYTNIKTTKKLTVADEYYIFLKYTAESGYLPINPIYTPKADETAKNEYYEVENPKVGYSFYSLDNGSTWTDTIGDSVDLGSRYNNMKANFYTDISVFTTTKNYNVSVSTSTDDPISVEDGGTVSVTLDLKNVTGDIDTKIYNLNKQDVTNKFKVIKDNNKYSIAGIVGTTVAGTYTAKFTYKDAEAEKTFKVISTAPSNVLVEKITIDGKNEVIAGGYLVLDATVTPTNATNKVLNWTSSDLKVATVNDEGIVTAVNEGTATITAEATDGSNVKGTIQVKVIGKKMEQLDNNVNDPNNDNTTKSPETGLSSITVILLVTMLTSIIAYITFKKKNLFKRV